MLPFVTTWMDLEAQDKYHVTFTHMWNLNKQNTQVKTLVQLLPEGSGLGGVKGVKGSRDLQWRPLCSVYDMALPCSTPETHIIKMKHSVLVKHLLKSYLLENNSSLFWCPRFSCYPFCENGKI